MRNALLFLSLTSAVWADQAVVVGVGSYPNLSKKSQLTGPPSDVADMKSLFESRGFTVTALVDGAASKAAVLNQIRQMVASAKPDENLVFYFSGHGSSEKTILCMDASNANAQGDISRAELRDAFGNSRPERVTIILDACHSGGMLAFKEEEAGLVARGIPPRSGFATVADDNASGFCYFTASRSDQVSYEKTLPGAGRRGLFTFALGKTVRGSSPNSSWSSLRDQVSGEANGFLANVRQDPVVTPRYETSRVHAFGGASIGPVGPTSVEVRNPFDSNFGQDSGGALTIIKTPGEAARVGQAFYLTVTSRQDGVLYVFNQDTQGAVNVLLPSGGNLNSARVVAGQSVPLPAPGHKFQFQHSGTENIKAVLVRNSADAQAFATWCTSRAPFRLTEPAGVLTSVVQIVVNP